jgi:hypothetical protein
VEITEAADIVVRGMSIRRSREGLRGRKRAGTNRKRLKEDTAIRFKDDALRSVVGGKCFCSPDNAEFIAQV